VAQLTTTRPHSPPPQSPPPQPPQADAATVPWLAAIAVVPILATVYQTLVLTDVTDDVIRKGIDAEHYSMIWTNVCWGIATLYGVFAGIWAMARFGARNTLLVGLAWFALGNLFCGAATDVPTLAAAKLVEGVGKGMVIMICRSLLYRQFDRMVIVAIGFYGVIAYATRPTTPLVTALINDALSWRWIFWVNVPLAMLAFPLVRRFIKPDRPAQPLPLRIDWVGVTLFVAWIVSLTFTFGWYRKWGGWTSNAFTATALLAMLLPLAMVAWVGAGLAPSEHFRRMFRVRVYVLAMWVRMLLLVQLLAVLTILADYCVSLRDYPREVAGWVLAPATLTMTISTLLTTWFHRRILRHFWLLVGVVGCAICLWWMSSVDNFTSKGQVALIVGCWGLFLGLLPPGFLQDEVEGLDRRDSLYGGALAVVFLVVPIVVIPTMTSTIVSAWTDRALDAQRLNLQENRPEVEAASARVADYYRQHGVEASDLPAMSSAVLGGFTREEAVAHGIQSGLRVLSLIVGGIGLLVTALLALGGAGKPA
jgi:MFS family permease